MSLNGGRPRWADVGQVLVLPDGVRGVVSMEVGHGRPTSAERNPPTSAPRSGLNGGRPRWADVGAAYKAGKSTTVGSQWRSATVGRRRAIRLILSKTDQSTSQWRSATVGQRRRVLAGGSTTEQQEVSMEVGHGGPASAGVSCCAGRATGRLNGGRPRWAGVGGCQSGPGPGPRSRLNGGRPRWAGVGRLASSSRM